MAENLEVAGVSARLGFDLDSRGAIQFEERLKKAQAQAREGAHAKLTADVDESVFKLYQQKLDEAQRRASTKKRIVANLGADFDSRALASALREQQRLEKQGEREATTIHQSGVRERVRIDAAAARETIKNDALIERERIRSDAEAARRAARRADDEERHALRSVRAAEEAARRIARAQSGGGGLGTIGQGGGGGGRSAVHSLLSDLGPESQNSINGLRQLGIAFRLIRTTAFVTAIASAVSALGTLTAGAAGAVAGLAPLGGLLATLPQYASAAGQALGTVLLAGQGVGSAVTAGLNAQNRVAQDATTKLGRLTSASNTLHNANQALASAQEQETVAQEGLNQAVDAATRKYEDLERAARHSALTEKEAVEAVQQARVNLRRAEKDPNAGALGVHQAETQLEQAKADLEDTRVAAKRARADYRDAVKAGVKGMPEVVDAQRAVRDAAKQTAEAHHDIKTAQQQETVAVDKGTSALNTYQAKLNGLAPTQRHFVEYIVNTLTPAYTKLQESAGEKLFGGVERGVRSAMKNFGLLRHATDQTSGALGRAAEKLGAFIGSKGFGRDFQTLSGRNVKLLNASTDGFLRLLRAVIDVTVAAGPLTDHVTKQITEFTKWIEKQAHAGRESGKLRDFFKKTIDVMDTMIDIVKQLGTAFYNLGKLAYPLGNDLFKALDKNAKRFKDWTESAKGENSIKEYFDNSRGSLNALGDLLVDVTKAFFRLGDGRKVVPLIKALDEQLLPALENVIDNASTSFAPAFVGAIAQILEIMQKLVGDNGPLVILVKLLDHTLTIINHIIDRVPVIGSVIGALVIGGGLLKALRLGATITGMNALIKLLRQARDIAAETRGIDAVAGGAGARGAVGAAEGIAEGVAGGAIAGRAGGVIAGVERTASGAIIMGPGYAAERRARLAARRAAASGIAEAAPGRFARAGARAGSAARTAGALGRGVSVALVGEGLTNLLSKAALPLAALVAFGTYVRTPGSVFQKLQGAASNLTFGIIPKPSSARGADARRNADQRALDDAQANLGTNVLRASLTRGGKLSQHTSTATIAGAFDELGRTAGKNFTTGSPEAQKQFDAYFQLSKALKIPLEQLEKLSKTDLGHLREQFDSVRPAVDKITGNLRRFSGSLKQIQFKDILDPNAAAQLFSNFDKMRRDGVGSIKELRDGLKFNVREISKAFEEGSASWSNAMTKNITVGIDSVRQGMKDGKISTKDGMQEISRLVKDNMKLARDNLDNLSADGKAKLAQNFRDAADAVKAQMERSGRVTKTGMDRVRRYLAQELQVYGFSLTEARNELKQGTRFDGGPDEGSRGPTGTGSVRATGGSIPQYGQPSPRTARRAGGGMASPYGGGSADDHVLLDPRGRPVAALSGTEGIVNTPQMGIIDYALGLAKQAAGLPWGNLGELWGSGMRHFARGGRLQLPATLHQPTHPTDGLLGYPANDIFGTPGTKVLSPISGRVTKLSGRPPSAGAYQGLGGPFGWSIYVSGGGRTYYLTHFGSKAVRLGQRVSRGQYLGDLGDYPGGVPDHIHEGLHNGPMALSGDASAAAAVKLLKSPKIRGGGAVGKATERALGLATTAANSVLSRISARSGDNARDSYSAAAAKPDANVVAAFRRAIRVKKASPIERLALWEAGIVESGLKNLYYGDADSLGALQERTSIYGRGHALNPYASATRFLSQVEALRPWRGSAGQLAQRVQGSAFPARYDAVAGQARKYLARGGRIAGAIASGIPRFKTGGKLPGVRLTGVPHVAPGLGGAKHPYDIKSLRKQTGTKITQYTTITDEIGRLQKQYSQKDRAYGQSEETLIDPDTGLVNKDQVDKRVAELTDLEQLRQTIYQKLQKAQQIVRRIVQTYTNIIERLTQSLQTARSKDRSGIKASITHYTAERTNWTDILDEMPFDIEDARLDVVDIANERAAVAGTKPEKRDAEQGLTPDQQAQLDQAQRLKDVITRGEFIENSAARIIGPGVDPSGVGVATTPAYSPALVQKAAAMGVDLNAGIGGGGGASGSGGSGGTTVYQTINTLHPADPETLRAIASASNSGNTYLGTVSSSREHLGV